MEIAIKNSVKSIFPLPSTSNLKKFKFFKIFGVVLFSLLITYTLNTCAPFSKLWNKI
jgi:hypothetical protein